MTSLKERNYMKQLLTNDDKRLLATLWAADQFSDNHIDVAENTTFRQEEYVTAIVNYTEQGLLKKVPDTYQAYTFTQKGKELVEGIIRSTLNN